MMMKSPLLGTRSVAKPYSNGLMRNASSRPKPSRVMSSNVDRKEVVCESQMDRRALLLGSTAAIGALAMPQISKAADLQESEITFTI